MTEERGNGLQVPGMPPPGKTTQGFRASVRKSFGNVRNFWKQQEGGGGVKRNYGRRLEAEAEPVPELQRVKLRRVPRPSQRPLRESHRAKEPPTQHPRSPSISPTRESRKKSTTQEVHGGADALPRTSRQTSHHSATSDVLPPPPPMRGSHQKSIHQEVHGGADALPRTSRQTSHHSATSDVLPPPPPMRGSHQKSIHQTPEVYNPAQEENIEEEEEVEATTEEEWEEGAPDRHSVLSERARSTIGQKMSERLSLESEKGHSMKRPSSDRQTVESERRLSFGRTSERQTTEMLEDPLGRASDRLHSMGRTSERESEKRRSSLAEPADRLSLETERLIPSMRRSSLLSEQRISGDFVSPPPPPPPPAFLKPPSFWHTQPKEREVLLKRPSIFLPVLLEEEKHFHELVADGNLSGVQDFLERRPNFNINCTNYQGVSALHIAVERGDEEMTEYLIAHPLLEAGDAHLFAIRDGRPIILRMLLERLQAVDPGLEFMACSGSAEFPETLTPLILAAESGHYEVISLLLDRGHRIPVPHHPRCFCKEECQVLMMTQDPLSLSSGKLHIYRALSNPAYICQTTDDPLLTAFQLSRELGACGKCDLTYISQYQDLAEALRSFSADIIAECRNSEEVEMILSEPRGCLVKSGFSSYPRLVLAVDYDQKEFVSHPNVQKVLEQIWVGDWIAWRKYRGPVKILYIFLRVPVLPVILGIMMFTPTSKWAKYYSIPINKLLSHIASYVVFLVLLFIQSNQDKIKQTRDTKPTGVEIFIVIYVIAFIYNTIRSSIFETPKRYFTFMWNVYEAIMEIFFILTFTFWIIAAIRATIAGEAYKSTERKYWKASDPELIAEGFFVLATIMAYLKILLICQISYEIGPLQVSLGKMTHDCAKFSVVFGIILLSFTAGLCKFYQYYEGMFQKSEASGEVDSKQENSFTGLLDTFKTLFWGLLGVTSFSYADVVIEPLKNDKGEEEINEHHFTEAVGYIAYAVFVVLTATVIFNMMTATMANTFQHITDNVETEWAFGRTEVKLTYINQPVLPPPFNILPTTRGILNLFKGAKDTAVRLSGKDVEKGLMEERRAEDYKMLMSQLVQRYFSTKNGEVS